MNKETLFQDFSVPTYDQWREEAEKSLKGASFDAKLLTKTYEGITLQPIYRKEDVQNLPHVAGVPGAAPYVRGTNALGYVTRGWEVSQEIPATSPKAFNEAAKHDLERGQTMLNLVLDRAALSGLDPNASVANTAVDHGVSIFHREDLDTAFSGLNLETLPLFLHTGYVALPMLALLLSHVEKAGADTSKLRGFVGADPLGTLLAEGQLPCSIQKCYDDLAQVTHWADQNAPHLRTIHVQSHPYHNSGANAVQELAFSLATAVEYIRALMERGLSIEQIAPKIQFSFSIGSQSFMEIAKLRAARLLWSTIVEAYGGSAEAQKMNIHARTSAWNKTVLDPYVNLLRASTEAFSAIIGGIDSLHVSAFDEVIRPANEFSRRIARNTQIILEQEAHLSKVADPAGGSWYVEWLTDALAEKAWRLFQQVEEQGGMLRAIEVDFPQSEIEQIAMKKSESIAQRKDRIVGTNMYANIQEQPIATDADTAIYQERLACLKAHIESHDQEAILESWKAKKSVAQDVMQQAVQAANSGATLGTLTKAWIDDQIQAATVRPLRIHRAAEAFESLRSRAEKHLQKTGDRPQVFLASVGPLAKHKARADFSAEFFAVGGFEVLRPDPVTKAEEATKAAVASGASIVVICSDDESYPSFVEEMARLFKTSKPDAILLLAGLPASEEINVYKAAGVDDFIHVRSNCYQMLHDLQERIGVMS
ncbi:methylmalonyl-CoA mutase family protein [Brevibacillus invocatus]|uniref:methylmalonyl-CoA mutase family protein n=1 Tax=Brevibacillus invocatus TaxID=173959 RepID=UPI0020407D1B|nr:methylmalonyl-CoA mutase family protein [Brevibacillus invocatus]MCM3081350.1 acyl-CoA mutase large subunit family protein [Brevibacillus invocatus]MCM3431662.1 acyl-CoA mutase large subunit family protein [Brevibacillus invocatus]